MTYDRVVGHELMGEGAPYDGVTRLNNGGIGGYGRARCTCGLLSGPMLTAGDRKAWHRVHKIAVKRERADA